MGYGRTPPKGHLPVHSVCCEDRAKSLIVFTCEMGRPGEYIARELVHEQTLDNLEAFSERLAATEKMLKPCPHCNCEICKVSSKQEHKMSCPVSKHGD